jgi:threonine dehydrogenase-like Zn-dependent dehydrogenase
MEETGPFRLHARNWLNDKKVLVAGLGAIGLLAAFALELQGAKLYGLDVVDESSTRPQLLKEMGGEYIDGRKTDALSIDEQYGHMDLIFEATGIAELEFQLIDALGVNGIYVLTGIPAGKRPVCILGASLMRQMVLKNQILLGSVNASLAHYAMAIEYLDQAHAKWKDSIERVITTIYPYTEFKEALSHHKHSEIKTVLSWNGRDRAVQ